MTRTSIALFISAVAWAAPVSRAAAPITVMILDGESGGSYHDWQRVTPALKTMLDETGLFTVTVVTAPPPGADFSTFSPAFTTFQAVVMNYDAPDERWPAALKASFERYISGGGGNDQLRGQGGNDRLNGGAGNDYVEGSNGNDRLTGGPGVDFFNGNAGDDLFTADDGEQDQIFGGRGDDSADADDEDVLDGIEATS